MVQFPNIPTDNQYKFRTVVFATFTVIALGLMSFLMYSLETPDDTQIIAERDAAWKKKDVVDTLMKNVGEGVDSLMNIEVSDTFEKALIQDVTIKLIDFEFELLKKKMNLEFEYIDKQELSYQRWSVKNSLYLIFMVPLLAGFGICFYQTLRGFGQWQKHLQRYQDAIIMKEAGVTKTEIKEYLRDKKEEEPKKKRNFFKRLRNKKEEE